MAMRRFAEPEELLGIRTDGDDTGSFDGIADSDGYGSRLCDSGEAVSVFDMPADGVAVAGVRSSVFAIRDRRHRGISESPALEWTDIEDGWGNSAAGGDALSTRPTVGASNADYSLWKPAVEHL